MGDARPDPVEDAARGERPRLARACAAAEHVPAGLGDHVQVGGSRVHVAAGQRSCRRTSRRDPRTAEGALASLRRREAVAPRARPCRRRTAVRRPRTWPSSRPRVACRPEAPRRGSRRPSSACRRRPGRGGASGCRRTSRSPRAGRSGRRPARRPSPRSRARDPLPLASDWHCRTPYSRANLAIMALDAPGQRLLRAAAPSRPARTRPGVSAARRRSARTDPGRPCTARDAPSGRA